MIWPGAYHSLTIIDSWIGKCIKGLSEIKMIFFFLFWGGMLNEIPLQQSTLLDCISSLSSLKLWFAWREGTLHKIRTKSQLSSVMYICLWIVIIFITEKNRVTLVLGKWWNSTLLVVRRVGSVTRTSSLCTFLRSLCLKRWCLLTLIWGMGSKGSRNVTLCHLRASMAPSRRGKGWWGGRSPLPNKVK